MMLAEMSVGKKVARKVERNVELKVEGKVERKVESSQRLWRRYVFSVENTTSRVFPESAF